jgi:hypothetical protein
MRRKCINIIIREDDLSVIAKEPADKMSHRCSQHIMIGMVVTESSAASDP